MADHQQADARAVIAQALASLEAAMASVTRSDLDATVDDLLAARLLLTTLIESLDRAAGDAD